MNGSPPFEIEGLEEIEFIAAGGFSSVYRAHDVNFRRQVAVKILHSLDREGRRRFERERSIMGQLSDHPHVITPLRSGTTTTGAPYLVMEYAPAGSFEDHLVSIGPMPWHEAVNRLIPICDALGYAHSQGILHRDVKPGNILSARSGPKLTDFGISAIREATATQVAFTIAHSPPETFMSGSDQRDERSDLYSLVSTLFTLIVGHPPYHTDMPDSQPAYMFRIAGAEIPTIDDLGIPAGLQDLIGTGLAKEPKERPQTAAELGSALEHLVNQRPRQVARKDATEGPDRPALATRTRESGTTVLVAHDGGILALCATSKNLISAGTDGLAHVWSLTDDRTDAPVYQAHSNAITAVSSLSHGRIISGSTDGTLRIWSEDHPSDRGQLFDLHKGPVTGLSVTSDGHVISCATDDDVLIWNTEDTNDATRIRHRLPVTATAVTAINSSTAITGSPSGVIQVWDLSERPSNFILAGCEGAVLGLEALSDDRVAAASADGNVYVWQLSPSAEPSIFFGHVSAVVALVELADGRIASASWDRTVRLWDPRALSRGSAVYSGHTSGVLALARFDDNRICSGAWDGTLRIWDPEEL